MRSENVPENVAKAPGAKYHISYNSIHKTVKRLAREVEASTFDPDVTVAIGTGGFIPARILKTFLKKPIFTVAIKYYSDDDNRPQDKPQTLQWIDEVEKKLLDKRILLVDEVDDSRTTLEYCLKELLRHNPREIAVMVLHIKRKPKRGAFPKEIRHYFVGEEVDDAWICYPWDALDIDEHDKLV